MKRLAITLCSFVLALGLGFVPASADHTGSHLSDTNGAPLNAAPRVEKGDWDFIANFPAGPVDERPLGVDVELFSRGNHRYVITSSMTLGFSIFDVTKPGDPVRVSDYGASVCGPEADVQHLVYFLTHNNDMSASSQALGGVHGWENDIQVTPGGKIAILASDAPGRCHDPQTGGMELVDISDVDSPKLLGLVRLRGFSHNTTIDQDRPWIAYNSDSDVSGNNFIDIVNFKSCLALKAATCRPHVARYQLKKPWTTGTHTIAPSACHDIVSMLHRLWGACVNTTLVLNPAHVWENGKLTGTDLTDRKQVGENACSLVDPSPEAMVAVKVVDCFNWSTDLWKKVHPENAHLKLVSLIRHSGYSSDEDLATRKDIQISHGAEPVLGGKILAVSDERGGGTNTAPGRCPGGGLWFYDIRNRNNPKVTHGPKKWKGVFVPRPGYRFQTQGSNCTAHVFWEWKPAHHLVSIAWYSSGTQVFRYHVDLHTHPATITFTDRRAFVPPGASTWTSRIYAQRKAPKGHIMLYLVATDIARGFDFFALTL